MSVEHDIENLIPAFALGATDTEESVQVKKYIEENPEGAAELAEFSQMTEALLFAVPLVKAPASLESRLFAALDLEAEGTPAETNKKYSAAAPSALQQAEPLLPWWKKIFNPSLAPQWAFAVAMLAVLVLMNGYWMRQVSKLQQIQLSMEEKLLQQETSLSVIAMDDVQRTVLPAVDEGSEAKADVIWGEGFEIAILYVEHFPQTESNKVYQLWLIKDGVRTSGGIFTVNDYGTGTLVINLPMPLDNFDALGVTVEPLGGSEEPTSPALVRGPITMVSE